MIFAACPVCTWACKMEFLSFSTSNHSSPLIEVGGRCRVVWEVWGRRQNITPKLNFFFLCITCIANIVPSKLNKRGGQPLRGTFFKFSILAAPLSFCQSSHSPPKTHEITNQPANVYPMPFPFVISRPCHHMFGNQSSKDHFRCAHPKILYIHA